MSYTPQSAEVPSSRTISTTAPVTGGGDLSADRALAIPKATLTVDGYIAATDFTTFNNKMTGNTAITGATKTKVTYDTKGLVTAGADATTADITDSTNKRYVTDAELTVLGNTSGTNTGDQSLSGYVPTSRTVNGYTLTVNITLTTADIADTTNKRYVTDAQLTVIGNTSGTNTGDQNLSGYVQATRTINGYALSSNVTLTAADIADSTNKRYVTDAELTVITNTSGTNTGDQDLSGKVTANTAITAATKTKITYDTKGLVTAGVDATTADVADSTDKRYVTDAQRTVIGNTLGTNTGDQDLSSYVPTSRTINTHALSANVTLATSDIADSTDKRYVTDAELAVLAATTGVNTGDQNLSSYVTTSDTRLRVFTHAFLFQGM